MSSTFPGADELIAAHAAALDAGTEGWSRRWTPETLRWRLAAPGASYRLTAVDGALLVSTAERRGPASIAILLAAFTARHRSRRETARLVYAVGRAHRAPVVVHAGHNARLVLRGLPLPERLRPSPLNLIARSFVDPPLLGTPSRFEFLDFDAY